MSTSFSRTLTSYYIQSYLLKDKYIKPPPLMFSWKCTNFLKQHKQPPEEFRKKGVLKISQYSQENTCIRAYLVFLESTLLKDPNTDIFL